jgi:hypothetical protein
VLDDHLVLWHRRTEIMMQLYLGQDHLVEQFPTTKTTTTASGRPHPEADQICRTQKTGNINGRGISET